MADSANNFIGLFLCWAIQALNINLFIATLVFLAQPLPFGALGKVFLVGEKDQHIAGQSDWTKQSTRFYKRQWLLWEENSVFKAKHNYFTFTRLAALHVVPSHNSGQG